MIDEELNRAIAVALSELEKSGDLIITCPSVEVVAGRIAEAALAVVPHSSLSSEELMGVRSLIVHALADDKFFNWEMPTLTGLTASEFQSVLRKLPE